MSDPAQLKPGPNMKYMTSREKDFKILKKSQLQRKTYLHFKCIEFSGNVQNYEILPYVEL